MIFLSSSMVRDSIRGLYNQLEFGEKKIFYNPGGRPAPNPQAPGTLVVVVLVEGLEVVDFPATMMTSPVRNPETTSVFPSQESPMTISTLSVGTVSLVEKVGMDHVFPLLHPLLELPEKFIVPEKLRPEPLNDPLSPNTLPDEPLEVTPLTEALFL
jgi:hypothetical protein